jgi:hypothetical protein
MKNVNFQFPFSYQMSILISRPFQIFTQILNLIVLILHCFPTSHRLNTSRYETQNFQRAKVLRWIIDDGVNIVTCFRKCIIISHILIPKSTIVIVSRIQNLLKKNRRTYVANEPYSETNVTLISAMPTRFMQERLHRLKGYGAQRHGIEFCWACLRCNSTQLPISGSLPKRTWIVQRQRRDRIDQAAELQATAVSGGWTEAW